jgi:hypothetical protein
VVVVSRVAGGSVPEAVVTSEEPLLFDPVQALASAQKQVIAISDRSDRVTGASGDAWWVSDGETLFVG